MVQNVIIGKPIVDFVGLIASDEEDWINNEYDNTLFTETRFLPAVMKEAGIVSSISEVRRNRPELCVTLNSLDCINLKWGKKFLYIVVGL